ncbi:hypothetical protein Krac_7801 [Ktedonobacter racemifer DSM 44963]|uniref:Uncharacterized protein n=1 Tax=Ktedonobacter racemifer DSM 44963 TaxID=485913 RepID=D6TL51_KTERA|nr:hypothetical protein Krac_7801 [Ktedonobacter racemifer DSM 44963]
MVTGWRSQPITIPPFPRGKDCAWLTCFCPWPTVTLDFDKVLEREGFEELILFGGNDGLL